MYSSLRQEVAKARDTGLPLQSGASPTQCFLPLPNHLHQHWCPHSLWGGGLQCMGLGSGLGVDGACDPWPGPTLPTTHLACRIASRPLLSGWTQELLSLSLQAGACCKLLLPALEPPGILCSNRSWGKPDCERLLTCLCGAPVTFPKPRTISWIHQYRLLPPLMTSTSPPNSLSKA